MADSGTEPPDSVADAIRSALLSLGLTGSITNLMLRHMLLQLNEKGIATAEDIEQLRSEAMKDERPRSPDAQGRRG